MATALEQAVSLFLCYMFHWLLYKAGTGNFKSNQQIEGFAMAAKRLKSRGIVAVLVLLLLPVQWAQAGKEGASDTATLYERLGGLMPISVVVSDLLDMVVPDPVLNENPAIDAARERVPKPYLKYQVTAMVCQAAGGPCQYTGRDMKTSHAHLNITEAEWSRFVALFKGVLEKHEVPEAEQGELLAIVDSTREDIVAGGN